MISENILVNMKFEMNDRWTLAALLVCEGHLSKKKKKFIYAKFFL